MRNTNSSNSSINTMTRNNGNIRRNELSFIRDPFEGLFESVFGNKPLMRSDAITNYGLEEYDDRFEYSLDMPGADRDEIEVEVTPEGILTVSRSESQTETDENEEDAVVHRYRSTEGTFSVKLPQTIDYNDINAELDKGVLIVKIPKPTDSDTNGNRKIEVM